MVIKLYTLAIITMAELDGPMSPVTCDPVQQKYSLGKKTFVKNGSNV